MPTPSERRALVRAHKETPRPMGVFRVRNVAESRSFVGSSTNLTGILNRHRFQLRAGNHASRPLQADWNRLGEDAFAFESLDELDPITEPGHDPTPDLEELETLWRERLAAAGEELYPRH